MSIGLGLPRVESPLKVTGRAKYAADNAPKGVLHAMLVGAPITTGRLVDVDARAALTLPGVVRVLTRADMPRFGKIAFPAAVLNLPLQSDEIHHAGETVALVLAETIEAAEAGAAAVVVRAEAEQPLLEGKGHRVRPAGTEFGAEDFAKGSVEEGLAKATFRIEASYVQPSRHHNPMETSGTVAEFKDGKLTLWDAVQAATNVPPVVAAALGLNPEDVRVIAPHTGGGFGCKGWVWPHQVLAAAAAIVLGRPVKLHLRRQDQYFGTGYQPWMRQDVALGADAGGRLTAIRYFAVNSTAINETHLEPSAEAAKAVYACPTIETRQDLDRAHVNLPTAMRAPVEGVGLWAIESAMNELADAIGVDPVDLRLINHADVDPRDGRPWSSKKLREAYAEGARLFGWRERGAMAKDDGPWRLGRGMATCSMGNFRMPGAARVMLRADGTAAIECSAQDIGAGGQTAFCQVASEELGLPFAKVKIHWGDTDLTRTGPTYGSSATMHTGSAVALACRDIREQLSRHSNSSDVVEALAQAELDSIVGEGRFILPGGFSVDGSGGSHAIRTFGAVFVEVAVDPDLGLVRLRRVAGAYSAGRIINPRTARSQMTGAIIWGWGKATMERSQQDPRHGRWLAANLSNVAMPVNADIPADIQIHFIDEVDEYASVIGAKGIGELGATGIDAAVAAAVHDAIGIRFRELPITPPKVLDALRPAQYA